MYKLTRMEAETIRRLTRLTGIFMTWAKRLIDFTFMLVRIQICGTNMEITSGSVWGWHAPCELPRTSRPSALFPLRWSLHYSSLLLTNHWLNLQTERIFSQDSDRTVQTLTNCLKHQAYLFTASTLIKTTFFWSGKIMLPVKPYKYLKWKSWSVD